MRIVVRVPDVSSGDSPNLQASDPYPVHYQIVIHFDQSTLLRHLFVAHRDPHGRNGRLWKTDTK
jgi:hypothetical protein